MICVLDAQQLTPEDDRQFFSQRIPAFSVIDFGSMNGNSVKSYTPINGSNSHFKKVTSDTDKNKAITVM